MTHDEVRDREILLYIYALGKLTNHDGFAETLDHIFEKVEKHLEGSEMIIPRLSNLHTKELGAFVNYIKTLIEKDQHE